METKNKSFYIRLTVCFALISALFLVAVIRMFSIITSYSVKADANDNSYTLNLCLLRKNIYDKDGKILTCEKKDKYAVISPVPEAIMYVSSNFPDDKKTQILNMLKSGKPAYCKVDSDIKCGGITVVETPVYADDTTLSKHFLGYLNNEGHGVCGLQKVFDDYLYTGKYLSVRFASSAFGEILLGIEPEIDEDSEISSSGVVTTLDYNIQKIVEKAAEKIETGAVLLTEVGSGKIRAAVSKPNYSLLNIEEYLNADNSPLINRNLCSFNVGSAFKPVVAAAAIENNKANVTYNCSGTLNVDGHNFNCHNLSGHGTVDLKEALTHSCNVYFYNLAIKLGGKSVYYYASAFGFGRDKVLYKNMTTNNEILPEEALLIGDKKALANLSIGQGSLLSSPLTMHNLYSAIALDGSYRNPVIIEGITENGVMKSKENEELKTRVISSSTAKSIRNCLENVVEQGTGIKAKPKFTTAAGKTATAQTGIINENGIEKEISWFCGYFPAENPMYVCSVIIENSENSEIHSTEVFSEIADETALLSAHNQRFQS